LVFVERIVDPRPVQGLLMIVPQVLGIVMIGSFASVAGEVFLLGDEGGLAVEGTGVRHEGCVRRTV